MLSVLGFLIILGPLVIVHELGHFLFAKLFGVKAETFSIGFGPKVWKRQKGETEFCISAIPLGGYVKLLGEDREAPLSPDEEKRALHKQAPWKKFFIFAGGPLFNFLFAIVVFMLILVVGEPKLSSVVGRVVHGTAAEKVGFQSGDAIHAVDGKPLKSFEDLMIVINESPGKALTFDVVHPGTQQSSKIVVTPETETGFSLYGEVTHVGQINGLEVAARGLLIGISDSNTSAFKLGVRSGDEVVSVNGTPLTSWEQLENFYTQALPGSELKIQIKKADKKDTLELLVKPAVGVSLEKSSGLRSSELFVDKPVPKSPAELAGVRPGDRLVRVGDKEVESFFQLREEIQKAGEKDGKVTLTWERDGVLKTEVITPTATPQRDPLLKKVFQYTVGVIPSMSIAEPVTYVERVWNPFVLLYRGTERMVTFTWRNLVSIQKMFTGDVSMATIGGPLTIGKIAGESLARGLTAFLTTMAMLSVGLGVFNILPVPVLDGGHLLILGIEMVFRRPLTLRAMEIIQLVGLSLILLLMAFVIKNDITRIWSF